MMVPVVFTWTEAEIIDGDGVATRRKVMLPLARYAKVADRQFHDSEEYPLVVLETRSRSSHSHFFAALKDGFDNLPENLSVIRERLGIKTVPRDGWLNPEHLRKWCLCETGSCEPLEVDFDDQKDAMRLARFYRARDEYCQIMIRGSHVTIRVAKSQSAAAMAKQPFEDSKKAVLELIESMTGLRKGALMKNAGRAA